MGPDRALGKGNLHGSAGRGEGSRGVKRRHPQGRGAAPSLRPSFGASLLVTVNFAVRGSDLLAQKIGALREEVRATLRE